MLKFARTLLLATVCTLAMLLASLEVRAAVIEVNTNLDEDNCGSTTVSLREAILIAQGQMSAANSYKLFQIVDQTGLIINPIPLPTIPNGCKSAPKGMLFYELFHQPKTPPFDTIQFVSGLGTIFLNSSLYPLSMIWEGGEINGKAPNGTNIIIDGSNMAGAATGISLGDNRYNLLNLEIRNFGGDGVVMDGTDNSVLRGLKVHHNGGHGIHIVSTHSLLGNPQNNEIGGTGSDQGNIIHSNGGDGINITGNTAYDRAFQNIRILNNVIGTADGIAASPNGGNGISLVNTWGVTVGDSTGATKNTISGNAHDGVQISGAEAVSNAVFWNNIGTDINGNARLGNGWSGVAFLADAGHNVDLVNRFENRVGKPGFPNLISANANGVDFGGTNTSHNIVQSNLIGTGNGGNTNLGNTSQGVYFHDGTFDNLIGGTGANQGNLIAFNGSGILATDGVRNSFKRNRIFSNVYLGIDLAPSVVGVTPNDQNDGDSGPNGLQNFPSITTVNSQSSFVSISGSLNSIPNQSFDLEFFGNADQDYSGYGEGRYFLGTARVNTNASGYAFFTGLSFSSTPSTVGSWVTATATDLNGNTSEFSQSINVCQSMSFSPTDYVAPVNGGTSSFGIVYSRGCSSYSAQSTVSWIAINSVFAGTVSYTVAANTGLAREGYININYNDGTGPRSKSFLVSQNLAPVGIPSILSITPGPERVTITLKPPSIPGNSPIVGYSATCVASGHPTVTATSTTTTVIVPGLVSGVSYACSAMASNGSYYSAASPASVVIPKPRVDLTPILMLLLD